MQAEQARARFIRPSYAVIEDGAGDGNPGRDVVRFGEQVCGRGEEVGLWRKEGQVTLPGAPKDKIIVAQRFKPELCP